VTPPCGRSDCPVVEPSPQLLRRIRTERWPAQIRVYRGHQLQHAADRLVPGTGDTRFAPLPDTEHAYVSVTKTAALLESALHHLSGPDPTIYLVELRRWAASPVRLTTPVRLIDLRDNHLRRLGIERQELVDTDPVHYPCTGRWAAVLLLRRVGGHPVAGIVWHSRQADLHARSQHEGLLADLLSHRATEVAVLWHPHGPPRPFETVGPRKRLVDSKDRPSRSILELSALTGAPIE
jgi:hypothetical protein